MKFIYIITFLFLLIQNLCAQKTIFQGTKSLNEYAVIDKKILQIPDSTTKTTEGIASFIKTNFVTATEKTRAIFFWVVSNIQYDVENMFAINFYEKKQEKISKALNTRKGICENYAALFNDLCLKSGIKSFVIDGYTKQNGFADYIPHAWCAAMLDSALFIFDPTWGSGYINNGKFYRKINNDYYRSNPASILKSHMPFDYLWQFVNYPITNQEFYVGKTQLNRSKPFFNYSDSILLYEKQDDIEQLMESAVRIEKNGVRNSLIYDRLQHIRLEIETNRQNQSVNLYNSSVADYNDGINNFNNFIQYRNKQFIPQKTDLEIQGMIDLVDSKFKSAKTKLSEINSNDSSILSLINQLTKSINDAETHLKEQQDWVKIYFTKGKSGRKSMFYDRKITWFGIPVN